tara:strand:- start:6 stop:440 length:435 start_codon:yes stop_codon:yes gene_type:complete
MTEELKLNKEAIEDMEIALLIKKLDNAKQQLDFYKQQYDTVKAQIETIAEIKGARVLYAGKKKCTISYSRKYDVDKLLANFADDEVMGALLDKAYKPATEKIVKVPHSVDGHLIKHWWDMGDDVVTKLQTCLLPSYKTVKVEEV